MNEELKKIFREIIMERYGVDIDEAVFRFSTQNYAFIFPDKPYMIRVSMSPKKTRQEILSEMMWIDDLKAFKETVCEPSPSLGGKLLEEFEAEGITYRAGMFRKAKGNVKAMPDMTPMFFICVGDLLGGIHQVSADEREMGMNYRRGKKADDFAEYRKNLEDRIPSDILQKILEIEGKVNALPQDIGQYGICHGDFHNNNFFVEENNIWLFDFDGCAYTHYLYDVASFIQSCLLAGYKTGEDARKVVYEDILPYFKIGYELNKKCDEQYWEELDLFIAYRTALSYMALFDIEECGVVDNLEQIKQFFGFIISQDDILDAMSKARMMQGK